MLTDIERGHLLDKIIRAKPVIDENIGGGCLSKAALLYNEMRGGEIFWVGCIYGISIMHAYYLPPNADENQIALNQADNGYSQYPPLTGKELRAIGQLQSIEVIRQYKR